MRKINIILVALWSFLSLMSTMHAANPTDERIQKLLAKGVSIEQPVTSGGRTLLHLAALGGSLATARMLIARGAPIDARDGEGNTPLHLAIQQGRPDMFELLIHLRADPVAANRFGNTPLHEATNFHRDGPLSTKDYTALHQIVETLAGTREMAWFMADYMINVPNNAGYTPLFNAISRGYTRVVRMLLESGADVNRVDRFGYTPIAKATIEGQPDIVQLLLWYGARVDVETVRLARLVAEDQLPEVTLAVQAAVNLLEKAYHQQLHAIEPSPTTVMATATPGPIRHHRTHKKDKEKSQDKGKGPAMPGGATSSAGSTGLFD